jgi:hypothetical protein
MATLNSPNNVGHNTFLEHMLILIMKINVSHVILSTHVELLGWVTLIVFFLKIKFV